MFNPQLKLLLDERAKRTVSSYLGIDSETIVVCVTDIIDKTFKTILTQFRLHVHRREILVKFVNGENRFEMVALVNI